MLIGLATAKCRSFELPSIDHDAGGDDTEGDVRRVEPMMRDWSFRIVGSAGSMHERRRAQCGLTRQPSIDEHASVARYVAAVGGSEFHEQIVRVLPIDKMTAAIG